ncbi:MAG: galactose oxidase early set domain-containing protein, partial [Nitrospira sp.]|nr:galactose oxidase early set domain-containing protein [Nitrospira sp.]
GGTNVLAARPIIVSAPSQTAWASPIEITANGPITRITLVRSGSATHAFNNEARFFDYPGLPPQAAHTITAPANPDIAPPGYYMIFAWNSAGVPSIAKIIKIE